MLAPSRFPLHTRVLVLFGVCLLVLGVLPPLPAQASFKQNTIDNSTANYSTGSFQRASLTSLVNLAASPKLTDLAGAVQLGPIGILKTWQESPFSLPKSLQHMGATAIGNRIYVIGGNAFVSSTSQPPVADVWSIPVSQVTGSPTEDWRAETALPAVKGSNQSGFDTPVAPISSPAIASVATSGGAGYIYVIGGNALTGAAGAFDFSSYAVRIGSVNTAGRITWAAGPAIPSPNPAIPVQQLGLQSAMAQSFTINGTTYIYVIGGLRRFRSGGGGGAVTSDGLKAVYYARVGAGGQLINPKTGTAGWGLLDAVPSPGDSPAGIWDGVVMADNYVVSTGATHDVLYVSGGQLTPDPSPTFNDAVYRAFINSDGTLDWDPGVWQGVMPQTRTGLSGVTFRGSLYAVGGIPSNGNEPDKGVLTTYVQDNLELHLFNGSEIPSGVEGDGSNYLKSDALPKPRTYAGIALVQAAVSSTSSAFVYVLGGRGDTSDGDPSDNNGSNSVIYGKIGGGEDTATTGYAPDAWYYSKPFDINFTGAQLQEISWATVIDRTVASPDIKIDYRVTSANTCATADWDDNSWKPLDGSKTDAFNSVNAQNQDTVPNLVARCFQYRAKLTTTDFHVTPSLLNLSIKVFVPGGPDLKVQALNKLGGGTKLTGLVVVIQNDNLIESPTLAADTESAGSFYVDLCIVGPSATPAPAVPTPTLPLSSSNTWSCDKAYADIEKSSMQPHTSLTIGQWLNPSNDQPLDILSFFTTPGYYTVMVAADSFNFVDEGTAGGETNNLSKPLSFQVETIGPPANTGIYLPIINR